MMKNIFDTSDLTDLPLSVKSNLKCIVRTKAFHQKISALLQKANRALTLDELLVAFYREYKVVLQRREFGNKLYYMALEKNPVIVKVRKTKGIYTLSAHNKENKNAR